MMEAGNMLKTILQLYWSFFQIGYTSFGGLSMVPLINSEMASHGWMTASEIADIIAIAEITPGPLGLNCATFAGMRVAGVLGAMTANLGVITPTLTIGAVAAACFEKFKNGSFLKSVIKGVRPASIGLVCGVILTQARSNYFSESGIEIGSILLALVCCYLLIKCKWSVPKTIGIAALVGVIFLRG